MLWVYWAGFRGKCWFLIKPTFACILHGGLIYITFCLSVHLDWTKNQTILCTIRPFKINYAVWVRNVPKRYEGRRWKKHTHRKNTGLYSEKNLLEKGIKVHFLFGCVFLTETVKGMRELTQTAQFILNSLIHILKSIRVRGLKSYHN